MNRKMGRVLLEKLDYGVCWCLRSYNEYSMNGLALGIGVGCYYYLTFEWFLMRKELRNDIGHYKYQLQNDNTLDETQREWIRNHLKKLRHHRLRTWFPSIHPDPVPSFWNKV